MKSFAPYRRNPKLPFPAVQRSRRISEVLSACGISPFLWAKAGKRYDRHGFLERSTQGHVALGPSARSLVFSPMKADVPAARLAGIEAGSVDRRDA